MPQIIENRVSGIVGRKGTGKTWRLSRMFCAERRALLYQPVRRNIECDHCASLVETDGNLDDIFDTLNNDVFRIVYKPPDSDFIRKGNRLTYTSLVPIAKMCYEVGDMTLFLDEAHMLMNQYTIDPELERIVFLARNTRLSIGWAAQSMEVHRDIRRNTDTFYFMRITEPSDLEKIAERCGQNCSDRVAELRCVRQEGERVIPGECFIWDSMAL
jgi:hypothetical protein